MCVCVCVCVCVCERERERERERESMPGGTQAGSGTNISGLEIPAALVAHDR